MKWDDARRALEKRLRRTPGVSRVNAFSAPPELPPHIAHEPHDATLLDLHAQPLSLRIGDKRLLQELSAQLSRATYKFDSYGTWDGSG